MVSSSGFDRVYQCTIDYLSRRVSDACMVIWSDLDLVGLERLFSLYPWEIWLGWTMALMWQLLWNGRILQAHQLFTTHFVLLYHKCKACALRVLCNKSPCQTPSHPSSERESISPWRHVRNSALKLRLLGILLILIIYIYIFCKYSVTNYSSTQSLNSNHYLI